MDPARILIVEDDAILAANLSDTVEKLGYRSAGLAGTGEQAVSMISEKLPDVILMDIRLRGKMTGIEAAEQIHEKYDIPIIYLTAYTDEILLQQAKTTYAYAFITKPVRERELRASLEMTLYKHKTEKQLAYERHLMNTLLDTIPDHIYFKDADSRFIRINKEMSRIFNLKNPEEAVGKTDFDFFSEAHARQAFEDEQEIIWSGKPIINLEEKETWPDGHVTWVSTTKLPLRDNQDHIIGTFGVSRDITEKKKTENRVLSLNRMYMVLSSINSLIVRRLDKQKLLDEACQIAIDQGGFQLSWIGNIDINTNSFVPVASAGVTNDYRDFLFNTISETMTGSRKMGADILKGQIVICDDIEHDERMTLYRNALKKLSYRSMAAFSLRMAERTIGVINFYSTELRFFNKEEVSLLEELANDISYALRSLDIENERKSAEVELHKERNLLRTVIDNIPDLIHVKDTASRIIAANSADARFIGAKKEEEVIGKSDYDFYPKNVAEGFLSDDQTVINTGRSIVDREQYLVDKEGQKRCVLISKLPLKDPHGQIIGLVGIGRDITEQKKMHDQLVHSQKVQSIGTLAGGIAHDFNNILGIILAYASLLDRSDGDKEKVSKGTSAITQAVGRGAALVRQILAFARQSGVLMKPMRIPDLINELMTMLKETFPKVIEFEIDIEKNLPFINADYTQMHQVMLNLCVNARDAMPRGGLISIKVKTVPLAMLAKQFSQAKNDLYVLIEVTDTGTGMDPETKNRIFDPFFTTKEQGKGTGLGLSVVYGVIQEHQGFIAVESVVDHGTTFSLYLPVPQEEKKIQETKIYQYVKSEKGSETILFVEDEDLLLDVVKSALEANGYKVLIANNGSDAIEIYKSKQNEISLVLTDMGLPKMGGIDEFALLKEINPKIKVIFASGFISIETRSELYKEGAKGFILKPYNVNEVLSMVREVLDEK